MKRRGFLLGLLAVCAFPVSRLAVYRPGVLTEDQRRFAREGYWVKSDKVRWVQGRAQSIGGWSA